ncbi:sigma 54-interacting transcriptional regulator [Marinomonas sp. M1K-6]|uniref:Sigma 54-interacting transcriptional regulator n=1 Tax=Marinomonas profundi TaxID=2726122 RepID=A0A847RCD2_9GAMM|nr:TyrR/PhhR family helix-turn-helix DNA-binding protein [Marinomonas profundi]NLQ17860.1 sigma 54-interacting transcriptional regulator [Marinomonas profundi]UDV03483.1 sigma 54-interacting transcriptional regulator [Marinomonas profundi]
MRLEIQCEDRIGMVREALDLFIPHQIDMRLVEVDTKRRCIYCGFPDIPFAKLQLLLSDIRRLDSVEDVKTVMFTPSEREHNALYTLLEALPDGVISVDLKGNITMVTELAADDLQLAIADLLHKPLQQCIKGLHFSKDAWANPREGMSKRVRVRNQTLLLEMKPIFVTDDDGVANPAGTVIYVKSKARLDRQAESLKQTPGVENCLENDFPSAVVKSAVMKQTLSQAKAFTELNAPLLVLGEVGTGKRNMIEALFQYWQQSQGAHDTVLIFRHAKNITINDLAELERLSGWWVIDEIEYLDAQIQAGLLNHLTRRSSGRACFDTTMRLLGVSSLSEAQLADGERLNKTLYYALATLVLPMPALRERKEDLAGLLQQALTVQSERHRLPVPSVAKSALTKMALYDWPGNLKELQNVCLQTLLKQKNEWVADDIRLAESHRRGEMTLINHSLEQTIKQWEAELLKALYPSFPSTRRLAKAVGMSHSAIAIKLKEYGIKSIEKPD